VADLRDHATRLRALEHDVLELRAGVKMMGRFGVGVIAVLNVAMALAFHFWR